MQIIQRFDDWLAEGETSSLTQGQVAFLDRCTRGKWTYNEGTGLVDIVGYFNCDGQGLKNLQGIRFGEVSENFLCNNNRLTLLEGAPQTVGGYFSCHDNTLTTLEGAPQTVDGNFLCYNNALTTLEGAPQTVGGMFFCFSNRLTSLVGAPQTVGGDFRCSVNRLITLEGAPQTIEGEIILGGDYYSPVIKMERGDWNLAGWLEILTKGTPEARDLIRTLPQLDPAALQQEIDRNPEGMLVKMKDFLRNPNFGGLKWPERLEQEKELLSDLGNIGL